MAKNSCESRSARTPKELSDESVGHVEPKKRLGQHFLRRKSVARRIVDALDVCSRDTVVEIGAGTGELTRLLVKKAGKVVAVEVDEACVPKLVRIEQFNPNLELFIADVRKLDLSDCTGGTAGCVTGVTGVTGRGVTGVIGNLPYHLSGEILFWLLSQREYWSRAVLTVQAEFADRLVAQPGEACYSALSVISRVFLHIRKLFSIPSEAFVPPPDVKSTVLRLFPAEEVNLPCGETEFIRLVKSCFAHRRKTLVNNLRLMGMESAHRLIAELGHPASVRPQELSADDYLELAGACS